MNRKDFLRYSLSAGVVVWAGTQVPGVIDDAEAANLFRVRRVNPRVFPQSVASGDPQKNGIVLWTRLRSLRRGNRVAWEISRDNTFRRPVLRGTARTGASKDNTVKIQLAGRRELKPFTTYYYRFIYNGNASRTGRFKTLPAPNADVAKVRFGYISCQDYTNGYFTALSYLSEENIDYVFHLGDYIYETVPPPGGNAFQGGGPENRQFEFPEDGNGDDGFEATSLRDYRFTYRKYRSDRNLQRVQERYAFIAVWDDHEFVNDCYGVSPSGEVDPPRQEQRRSSANRAWAEYQPVGTVGLGASPDNGRVRYRPGVEDPTAEIGIYRSFAFGNLMELVMTDERLYRDSHPCGEETPDKYFTPGCGAIDEPGRTMLGARQKEYFLDKITNSTRTWKIWGNETMIMQLKLANTYLQGGTDEIFSDVSQDQNGDGVYTSLDQWDGYQAERREIAQRIRAAGTENFVTITGDIHTFIAGYVKDDYDNPLNDPTNAIGTAFVCGSITSSNLLELALGADNGGAGDNSRVPQLTEQGFSGLQTAFQQGSNPHFEFFDSSTHGYNLMEVTKSELICTMKAVSTIQQPQAELSTLARFRVPAGQVQIIRTDVPATAPAP
ncbi:MAG: alkaline phosphatase D family protein [Rubrobacteraceae bacterium]